MEPPSPPGLLLLGGQSTEGPLISVETFGFENCTIPPLPETRYAFGSFIAPTPTPELAVCGGWWMGKPNSTDCLTLTVTSGQWERGTFTNGPLGDGVVGVIHLQSHGVFIVHSSGMSLLASNTKAWVAGPIFSAPAVCSCEISSSNFVTVHMSDMHNVHGYSVTNGKAKPEPIHTWPSLLTKRQGPGCGATPFHFVVAGGVSELDEILDSVEVFDIQSKSLRTGGSLRQARAYFQIVRVGATYSRLLALGGRSAYSTLGTSEWWEEEEDSWQEGPPLSTERSNFGALMAHARLVCTKGVSSAYSCPAAHSEVETCNFMGMDSGASMIANLICNMRND